MEQTVRSLDLHIFFKHSWLGNGSFCGMRPSQSYQFCTLSYNPTILAQMINHPMSFRYAHAEKDAAKSPSQQNCPTYCRYGHATRHLWVQTGLQIYIVSDLPRLVVRKAK